MGFNTGISSDSAARQESERNVAAAVTYLRQGWYAQAFLLLSEPGVEKYPAACFALGLCHVQAGTAIKECFSEAAGEQENNTKELQAAIVCKIIYRNSEGNQYG